MNPSLMTNELLSVYFLIGTFPYSLSLYKSLIDSFTRRDLKNISYPLNCSLMSQCIHRLQFSSTLCRYYSRDQSHNYRDQSCNNGSFKAESKFKGDLH